tara:strand:+ start:379 stop:1107 length:729 start_codon:yes stop_codon:yes gene_type:complete
MIYEFSNFVDSYDNADGESKERMAISQFSKILGQSPKTIEVAISDADIDVPTGASKQDLIQIIRENKDNENLRDHLGTLVLVQAKAEGEGLNFFGKKADGTQRSGSKLFSGIGNMFKKKDATGGTGLPTTGGTEKKGWFKGLFSSNKDPKTGAKQPSKFGSWFKSNSEGIANIGGSLLSGLFSSKGSDNASQQSEYYAGQGQPAPNSGGGNDGGKSGMGKKILIGVGALGVLGLIIYLVKRK